MAGIYIMMIVTVVFSGAVWSGILYTLSGRQVKYLLLILPGLPLSMLINLFVKHPLPGLVAAMAGIQPVFRLSSPWWFLLFLAFMAPITEELTKIIPLLLPPIRKQIQGMRTGLWTGLALGTGFGLGEVVYLAYLTANTPQYASLPWHSFIGFFTERLVVVGVHGILTGILVFGIAQGSASGLRSYGIAVLLHLLVNLGSLLTGLRILSFVPSQIVFTIALLVLAWVFDRIRQKAAVMEGIMQKQEIVYDRQHQ